MASAAAAAMSESNYSQYRIEKTIEKMPIQKARDIIMRLKP